MSADRSILASDDEPPLPDGATPLFDDALVPQPPLLAHASKIVAWAHRRAVIPTCYRTLFNR
jgi:hypothetical protein